MTAPLRLSVNGPPVEVRIWAKRLHARWIEAGDPLWWLPGPPAWLPLSSLLDTYKHPETVYYVMDLRRAGRTHSVGIYLCAIQLRQLAGAPFPDVNAAIAAYAFGYRP